MIFLKGEIKMLFETNNFNDNYGLDLSFFNLSMNDSDKSLNNLYEPYEGFIRGNMFKDEYKPYKNYEVAKIMAKDNKEQLLLKIFALDFAINDLNLYLDLHPQDKEMFDLFKKYIKESNRYKEEYVNLVGPLCLTDVTSNSYSWLNTWPWEKGGNI